MPAAAWTRDARDLTYDPSQWPNYITIEQLAAAIGLKVRTLRDNMARPRITNPTVPRGAICRPAARIGNNIPLFSPEQRDEYLRRAEAAKNQKKVLDNLPALTAGVAYTRGLVTLTELADELNCELNTLRRIGRDHGIPAPVAVAARETPGLHGRQHELRDRIQVLRWIRHYSNASGARDRVQLTPAMLAEVEAAERADARGEAVPA